MGLKNTNKHFNKGYINSCITACCRSHFGLFSRWSLQAAVDLGGSPWRSVTLPRKDLALYFNKKDIALYSYIKFKKYECRVSTSFKPQSGSVDRVQCQTCFGFSFRVLFVLTCLVSNYCLANCWAILCTLHCIYSSIFLLCPLVSNWSD